MNKGIRNLKVTSKIATIASTGFTLTSASFLGKAIFLGINGENFSPVIGSSVACLYGGCVFYGLSAILKRLHDMKNENNLAFRLYNKAIVSPISVSSFKESEIKPDYRYLRLCNVGNVGPITISETGEVQKVLCK